MEPSTLPSPGRDLMLLTTDYRHMYHLHPKRAISVVSYLPSRSAHVLSSPAFVMSTAR